MRHRTYNVSGMDLTPSSLITVNDLHCTNTTSCLYKSVIIGKLLYAVSAWWGFASAADRKRLQALLQHGIRSGLCSPETPNLTELAESIDDALFQRIMHNP